MKLRSLINRLAACTQIRVILDEYTEVKGEICDVDFFNWICARYGDHYVDCITAKREDNITILLLWDDEEDDAE